LKSIHFQKSIKINHPAPLASLSECPVGRAIVQIVIVTAQLVWTFSVIHDRNSRCSILRFNRS